MNTMVSDSSSRKWASRFRICAWTETSSALTGSSATTNVGTERERPRDPDPLALAAGECVREAVGGVGRQADEPEHLALRAPGAARAEPTRCARSGSAMIAPTFIRGFSDA